MAKYYGYCYNEDGQFTEMIPLEEKLIYEKDIVIGYGPDIPKNCTLEVCPDLIYDPVFKDGKWIKLKPELPPQPEPGPSEIDKLKTELEVTKAAMAEFIMQQTLKGMGM